MRRLALGFMCCLLLMLSASHVKAQTCNGSLGDPVVSESFDQQGALPAGQAQNIQYTTNTCPQDGQYTVVRSFLSPCNNTWHSVASDHTGNGGYMMVVNASYTKSQFFEKRVRGLCGNTVYELSVYILDLMRLDIESDAVKHPALRFVIEDLNGNIIKNTTINIKPTAGPEFQKCGVTFETTANTDVIVLKIFNDADGGYGNDFILDDISFSACGPQVSAAFTDIGEQDYAPQCPSSGTKQYTMRATTSQTGYVYQWQQFINDQWQDIPGANADTYVANIDLSKGGKYEYRAGVAKAGNLGSEYCRVYSLPRTILIYDKPVVASVPNRTVCRGESVTINLSGGARYFISSNNGFTAETTNSSYTLLPADLRDGANNFTVYAESAEGCPGDNTTFAITVKPPFTTTVTANADTICDGQFVQLEATNNIADNYTYSWSPAAGLSATDVADPVASPQKTTTYTVTVSNGACTDTKQITITVLHPPAIELAERREMFEGTPIRFDPVYSGDITSYRWFPEEGLDDPTKPNPLVVATEDMTYTVTATGPCAIAIATVSVRVYQKINIPNTFTPNGDGINDVWNIEDLATYPTSETLIFNRNGQQVFRSIGYTTPWDGRFNSSQLPAGTYYYIIDLKNNTPKVAGYVTLLR